MPYDIPAGNHFRRASPEEKFLPGEHWIEIRKGVGTGWYVCEWWVVPADEISEPYARVGKYKEDEMEAAKDALAVAEKLDLPWRLRFTDEELGLPPQQADHD